MLPEFSVSEFVALVNQTFEFAYSRVAVNGELANFRVSKNKWVYFDLIDEEASIKCFGTIYQLPGPLENGMVLSVIGTPKLHSRYGFSLNIANIQPVGEGSIRKAANLLEAKLTKEGLFDPSRKRDLPYPPQRIGLIASEQSAAYADFMKILNARWSGVEIVFADVQVQGDLAGEQIIQALADLNQVQPQLEVIVITRGGGSPEDLASFNDERVVRAVAASRVVTLVAIGHEIDVSLSELAADQRGSTPSNAAELLTPDKRELSNVLAGKLKQIEGLVTRHIETNLEALAYAKERLHQLINDKLEERDGQLRHQRQLFTALDPALPLRRGYALVRSSSGKIIRTIADVHKGAKISVKLNNGAFTAQVEEVDEE